MSVFPLTTGMFQGNSVFLADAVSIPAQGVLLDLLLLVQDFLDIILSKVSIQAKKCPNCVLCACCTQHCLPFHLAGRSESLG